MSIGTREVKRVLCSLIGVALASGVAGIGELDQEELQLAESNIEGSRSHATRGGQRWPEEVEFGGGDAGKAMAGYRKLRQHRIYQIWLRVSVLELRLDLGLRRARNGGGGVGKVVGGLGVMMAAAHAWNFNNTERGRKIVRGRGRSSRRELGSAFSVACEVADGGPGRLELEPGDGRWEQRYGRGRGGEKMVKKTQTFIYKNL